MIFTPITTSRAQFLKQIGSWSRLFLVAAVFGLTHQQQEKLGTFNTWLSFSNILDVGPDHLISVLVY